MTTMDLEKIDEKGKLNFGTKYKNKFVSIFHVDDVSLIIPVDDRIAELFKNIDEKLKDAELSSLNLNEIEIEAREKIYKKHYKN